MTTRRSAINAAFQDPPFRFDCSSREATQASLITAFRCSVLALREFVADPNLGITYERDWEELPPFGRWLFKQACARLGPPALPTELCWFHGTRVPASSDFLEGIIPLGQWLPRLQAVVDATLDDVD